MGVNLGLGRLKGWFAGAAIGLSNKLVVEAVLSELAPGRTRLLDVGCGDGGLSARVAARLPAVTLFGLEGEADSASAARQQGVRAVVANLERPFPLEDDSFDVVVCNQVIEHIVDLDAFVTELVRVTTPGGAVVVATPNLASWTNVAALVLGQQAFSQSISQRWHIGNRFARRYRMPFEWSYPLHKHILTYQGLRDLFEVYGMRLTACRGAGYFPLPPEVGRLDRIHAQYLVAIAHKPRQA